MRPLHQQRRNWAWRAYITQQPLDLRGMHTSRCPLSNIIRLPCPRHGYWTLRTGVHTILYIPWLLPNLHASCHCTSQVGWQHSWGAQSPQDIKRGSALSPAVSEYTFVFFLGFYRHGIPCFCCRPQNVENGQPLVPDGGAASWRWYSRLYVEEFVASLTTITPVVVLSVKPCRQLM